MLESIQGSQIIIIRIDFLQIMQILQPSQPMQVIIAYIQPPQVHVRRQINNLLYSIVRRIQYLQGSSLKLKHADHIMLNIEQS